MKIEWHATDVQAGRRIGYPGRAEQWIVGYIAGTTTDEPRWVLVSLTDGMVQAPPATRAQMAEVLNKIGDFPSELLPRLER